jgi:hypothetical protein
MTTLTQPRSTAEFLVSEANGHRSREKGTITVPANTTIPVGRVMARITLTGKYVPHDPAGTDNGTRTAVGVLFEAVTNATGGAVDHSRTVIVRDAEVVAAHLTYHAAADAPARATANAALAAVGIIAR